MVEERVVTYFCLIEGGPFSTHMEVLEAPTAHAALKETARLLAQHPRAVTAEIFSERGTLAILRCDRGLKQWRGIDGGRDRD